MERDKISLYKFKTGYLDESGDSGKSGSKYLVLTYICTDDGKKIAKILKKTREQLIRTKKGERWLDRFGGEIKFAGFPEESLRLKLIENISKLNFEVKFVAIKKEGKDIPETEKSQILYNLFAESFTNPICIPSKILQAADLISGSIFQELENNNNTYTNILRKHLKLNGLIKRYRKE